MQLMKPRYIQTWDKIKKNEDRTHIYKQYQALLKRMHLRKKNILLKVIMSQPGLWPDPGRKDRILIWQQLLVPQQMKICFTNHLRVTWQTVGKTARTPTSLQSMQLSTAAHEQEPHTQYLSTIIVLMTIQQILGQMEDNIPMSRQLTLLLMWRPRLSQQKVVVNWLYKREK